jgi:hypothetical protein
MLLDRGPRLLDTHLTFIRYQSRHPITKDFFAWPISGANLRFGTHVHFVRCVPMLDYHPELHSSKEVLNFVAVKYATYRSHSFLYHEHAT